MQVLAVLADLDAFAGFGGVNMYEPLHQVFSLDLAAFELCARRSSEVGLCLLPGGIQHHSTLCHIGSWRYLIITLLEQMQTQL